MSRWHQTSCKLPRVCVVGGIPFCDACDALGDCTNVEPDLSSGIPRAPELSTEGLQNLSWPPSVQYEQDTCNIDIPGALSCAPSLPQAAPLLVVSRPSQALYTPVGTDDLRLLLLSKGDFDDPIHGTLKVSSFSDNVSFDALSYAWADETGDDSRRAIIFLGPFWDPFKITANCSAALRRMRREDRDVTVWVDAVCIDQGNHVERNHQVGLMAKIYSSARELFVYLGEGRKELEEVVTQLQWFETAKSIDPTLIQALFRCRYFSRMWIIRGCERKGSHHPLRSQEHQMD